jgi:hypothetical protein
MFVFRAVKSLAFGSLCLFVAAPAVMAQTAQITGRVTDASAAVVPGAHINVTNVATAVERRVETNGDGYYTVPLLLPGQYTIGVEQQGFKAVTRAGVVLEVDQRAEINFALEVGGISERVEVQAAATQLNTVEGSQGQVIDNRRLVVLPLNGRTYDDLALLAPGTVQSLDNARFGGFSSGGMRDTQNNFILDGVDNNPAELAGAQRRSEMVQPSIDAIQEFKVQTNAYAAEYGRGMGSVVNLTTRNGTNELHGSLFEFLATRSWMPRTSSIRPDRSLLSSVISMGSPSAVPSTFPKSSTARTRSSFSVTGRAVSCASAARTRARCPRWPCATAISANY